MHLWIERVPTCENIADLPSREEYGLMEAIGAQWVPPMLATMYAKITGKYWETLVSTVMSCFWFKWSGIVCPGVERS